jgi:polyphosphate glucokinase
VYLDTVEFLFAPDLIILGGGISRASKVSKYLRYLSTRAELVPSILENEAGIIGAAYAARDLAAGSG